MSMMKEMRNFNTSPSYLASNLFFPLKPRIGANTYLNVNILPDFIAYIKQQLTSQQLIALSEYQLQTYIMQLSIKQKINQSFQCFVEKIIHNIKTTKQFWIHGKINHNHEDQQDQEKKHQNQAIIQYPQDILHIQQKIPPYSQRTFKPDNKRRIKQSLEILNQNDYLQPTKQTLKLTLNNYSMMPAYVIQCFYSQKNKDKQVTRYDDLNSQQKEILNKLEEIVEFILMSQKQKNIKKQYIKTRSLERNRKVTQNNNNNQPILLQQGYEFQQKQSEFEQNQQKIANPRQQYDNQQDQPTEFYNNFEISIQKKQFYDSRMFNKTKQINQSHNILSILNCSIYLLNGLEQKWFEKIWKELEEQRILKEKRNRQQQQSEESAQDNENNQQQQQQKQQKQINDDEGKIIEENEQKQQKKQERQEKIVDEIIQIGIKKPIFSQSWKTPSFKFQKLITNIQLKIMSMRQIYYLSNYIIHHKIHSFSFYRKIQQQLQTQSKYLQTALISPQIDLDQILNDYKQMIEHPQNVKLTSFKTEGITIPWDQSDYLIFLKGLLEYFFVPTNNKKIAIFMSKANKYIQANHVKYVKNLYLKNMQTRIDRGQSGGGKKSRMLGKLQFLEKDIEFFSMRWFQKIKKGKKKKNKRRNSSDDAAEDVDSAY